MKYVQLNNDIIEHEEENRILKFLYNTSVGRIFLKILIMPVVSKFIGKILSLKISKNISKIYIKKYNIDMSKFEKNDYNNFNDFFTRKLKRIDNKSNINEFIATAESKVSCYSISDDLIINIKNTKYSIKELLKDEKIVQDYSEGMCIIYRLAPSNYHRYIFVDNGYQKKIKKIKGKLHTVNPIIYEKYKVFTENQREVCILDTENFGQIIQIEVGALCVGKISNNDKINFKKYEEKGFFEFGGSTIIQLLKKNTIKINTQIINNSKENMETKVNIGDVIGNKIEKR